MNKSTRFLCVGNGWFPHSQGGLNRYVYEMIHHLAIQNNEIELCGIGLPNQSDHSRIICTNLANTKDSILKRLWSTRYSFAHRSFQKPDCINLHFALYSLPIISQLPSDIPITFTFQVPWFLESKQEHNSFLNIRFKKWIEQQVYRKCHHFIVLSRAFQKILHQNYQIPIDKIKVIPGGVNTKRFINNLSRSEARKQLNWEQNRFILFTPRRLVHRMGIDLLLNALSQVVTPQSEVWLAIAGRGILEQKLKTQVKNLGLENNVKFLGFLPDELLPVAYQAADLTVIPSQSLEGFGLVVLESLACGTPVLCTPVGGMPEILEPFTPELITDSATIQGISSLLNDIFQDKIKLPSRQSCRAYVLDQYDWNYIVKQIQRTLVIR